MPVVWFRLGAHRRGWTSVAVLTAYALLAFLYLGLRLLIEPGSTYLGFGADPKAFIWCFGWWPHAILHGQNPFVSHAIWAPDGVNLIWTTSVPGLALLFAPVTLLFGPVDSYNAATVLLPAFAAWTAFLLCRHLTRAVWPSLVGGYLFGFSSYVLGQEEGHPHMTAVFLIPLVALVVVRFVEGELNGRALALRLGPLLGFEFLLSTELTFTLALAMALALVLGIAFLPRYRRRLGALLVPLAGACLVAALLTAPFVYYAVTGFQSGAFHPPNFYVTDLYNFAVPTKLALASLGWARSIGRSFPGNSSEQGAYLGLPVLLIVALYVFSSARVASRRFLLAALMLAVLGTLGAHLTVGGQRLISFPWALVGSWPLFDNVLPERLTLYVSFLTAIIVALWAAARPPGVLRWLLPGLAVLALLPNPAAGVWASRYTVPAFFTAAAYRSCLDPGENILPLPVKDQSESMLWQALSDYRFTMAGGNIAPAPPASFRRNPSISLIAYGYPITASQSGIFTTYITAKHVTSAVLDPAYASDWEAALDNLAPPEQVGGVVLYHFTATAPSCLGG